MEARANLEQRVHHLVEVKSDVEQKIDESRIGPDKVHSLRQMTVQLLRELHSLGEVKDLDVGGGIDFYNEVRRFEIDMIERALAHTNGHQRRAAKLLNLKVTTLNSKIKQYEIRLNVMADGR
ncbi:MAG TPA: helix-turn-helix domain-containing protein [Pyrinomonadaceae bacterium]|nr:helix-turn-helix domain-containing protein [Pyrinomonadaceae bacterium]